jgi:ribonuclease PH
VAVGLACAKLVSAGVLKKSPIKKLVAAVSVGVVDGVAMLDLNYEEDKSASVDFNLVVTEDGQFVEVQGAGEEATFSQEEFTAMLDLGQRGARQLIKAQRAALAPAEASRFQVPGSVWDALSPQPAHQQQEASKS